MTRSDRRRTVLVTGVGGNVGQGVLRALRDTPHPLRLVGSNVVAACGGSHLCERVHVLPFAWDPGYVEGVQELCRDERVELVIPATDHETAVLAAADGLPLVATSPARACATFLDKWETAQQFVALDLPFARSVLPSQWRGQFERTVVKPRRGRGSRDVWVDVDDPGSFDESFVVQERAVGREVTVAWYTGRRGGVHGFIALERRLDSGTTIACEVTRDLDSQLSPLLDTLSESMRLAGSCNLQMIVTEDRELVPFEVNCRLSGTTSIRARLGFPDARWTVEEWLLGLHPEPPAIISGSAVRLLMDVVYPSVGLDRVGLGALSHEIF